MLLQPRQEHFGLDISDRSLKAVQFKPTLAGKLELVALSAKELEAGVINEGEIKQAEPLVRAITELITKPTLGKFTTSYAVVSLPESKSFIKVIDIPPMSEEEIPQAVKWEAEHHIPIPIDETYWDWQQVAQATAANARLPILLGVVPRAIVDSYNAVLSQARLVPIAMEIEAVAIGRSLLPPNPNPEEAIMIIDIGATQTSLVVADHGTIQFTVSLPISGRKITETIATTLNLNEGQAEKAKIVCGLDPKKCHGAMGQILYQVMDELIRRIGEAMVFYREHFPNGHKLNQIILCGGGANFKFIDQHLADKLSLTVRRGNPWYNVEPSPAPLKPNELISYTTAIGLALRNVSLNNNHD
ncbi:MAG: type IV pilus assembly protein PilM [Candidatus Kerfeldbacteria bacterium]|nr:type IV pilus assembly protein PilM [Candidatus Kerfeldbacteria bacterium]